MKNKLLSALLAAAIAIGLWVYVVTVVSPNSEKTYHNIPVTIQLADDMMLISEQPTITLKLSGNRTNLNRMDENNINVVADGTHLDKATSDQLKFRVEYPFGLTSNEITLVESSLDQINVKVDEKMEKPVPVVTVFSGSVKDGFLPDTENPVLSVSTIEVVGPATTVSKIEQAKILIDLEQKTQSIEGDFVYELCDADGNPVQTDPELVTTAVETVNVMVQILRVKEINLLVNVIAGGGANEQNTTVTVSPQTIEVSGTEEQLAELDQLVLGEIHLAQILENESITLPIVLPEGVNNETGLTEATVHIQMPELSVKKLSVSNIKAINVPEGMSVDMITQVLEVTLRGSKRMIEAIQAEDVIITVDFAGKTAGTQKLRAEITVSSNYTEVGAIGTYTVSATVQQEA